jgi:hypothetical protein
VVKIDPHRAATDSMTEEVIQAGYFDDHRVALAMWDRLVQVRE